MWPLTTGSTGQLQLHRAHQDTAASTSTSSRHPRPLPPVPRHHRPVLAGIPPSSAAAQQIRSAFFAVDACLRCTVAADDDGRRPRTVATATVRQQRKRRSRPLPSPVRPRPPSSHRRRGRRWRSGSRSERVGYLRPAVERRNLSGRRPLVYPRLKEERFHRWRSARGLDRPDDAATVDTQIPATTAASVGARRRRRRRDVLVRRRAMAA